MPDGTSKHSTKIEFIDLSIYINSQNPQKMSFVETQNAVIDILKTIYDPEIPVNIYELGLVYEVNVDTDNNVIVIMTLTSPSCPVAGTLPTEVEDKIKGLAGVTSAKVNLTFEPQWTHDLMSEEAKLELGFL
jgi:FeS assembly SUF system protein